MVQSVAAVAHFETTELPVSLSVELANSVQEVEACKQLRYQIFAEEMGAHLHSRRPGIDEDEFDDFCIHLMVRDNATRRIVATTRLMLDRDARRGHGFYSESEFDLSRVLRQDGTFLEVGRTCIHRDYRSRSALATLWSGLARVVEIHDVDYLIGCASIEMTDRGLGARSLIERLAGKYSLPAELAATPRLALPPVDGIAREDILVPPLLKGYLRLGARVSREACWDPDFNVADLFVMLDRDNLERRYARHFMGNT